MEKLERYNGNHAEKKIMSHITQQNQNSTNIDSIQLNIQNTSDEFKVLAMAVAVKMVWVVPSKTLKI